MRAADSVFVPAPPERVLAALLAVERYPLWWPAALRVRVVSPPPHGLGSIVEIRALGSRFRCRIAAVEPPSPGVPQVHLHRELVTRGAGFDCRRRPVRQSPATT